MIRALIILFLFSLSIKSFGQEGVIPEIHFELNSTNYTSYPKDNMYIGDYHKDDMWTKVSPDTLRYLLMTTISILRNTNPNTFFTISGYSDSTETRDTLLGYLRAKKVKLFFLQMGVSPKKMRIKGCCYKDVKMPDRLNSALDNAIVTIGVDL